MTRSAGKRGRWQLSQHCGIPTAGPGHPWMHDGLPACRHNPCRSPAKEETNAKQAPVVEQDHPQSDIHNARPGLKSFRHEARLHIVRPVCPPVRGNIAPPSIPISAIRQAGCSYASADHLEDASRGTNERNQWRATAVTSASLSALYAISGTSPSRGRSTRHREDRPKGPDDKVAQEVMAGVQGACLRGVRTATASGHFRGKAISRSRTWQAT